MLERSRSDSTVRVAVSALVGAALAALLLLAAASPAESQRRFDRDRSRNGDGEIGRGYFQAGYMALDLDELNTSLTGAGYPALDDTFLTLGGGGYGTSGRFLVGGEGHGILGSKETTPDGSYQVEASGGYGLFRVGYLAFEHEGWEVYPSLGIGGGGMNLEIAERSAPTFDDILDDPERSADLSTGMFLLDASISANYRFPAFETGDDRDDDDGRGRRGRRNRSDRSDRDDVGGLLLGVQAGYTFAPGDTSWELDGLNDVAGGPALQIEGAYLRISIGGWGMSGDEDD